MNWSTGERETSANAYLNAARYPDVRSRIDVRTEAHVARLVFDEGASTREKQVPRGARERASLEGTPSIQGYPRREQRAPNLW